MLRYRARMGRELCVTYNKIGNRTSSNSSTIRKKWNIFIASDSPAIKVPGARASRYGGGKVNFFFENLSLVPETREVMEHFKLVFGSGTSDLAKIRPLKNWTSWISWKSSLFGNFHQVWKPRPPNRRIAELPVVTAIPTETGDVEVRRSTGVNRLPHHRPCDISSKQNYSNRLHSRDLIVLGLIEVLWLSEDRYKILTIFRTSSFNASEYVDHKIQI